MRSTVSSLLDTVDMSRVFSSPKWAARTTGSRRWAASSTSGLWNAPETRSRTTFAPSSRAFSPTAATPPSRPEITSWPGQL